MPANHRPAAKAPAVSSKFDEYTGRLAFAVRPYVCPSVRPSFYHLFVRPMKYVCVTPHVAEHTLIIFVYMYVHEVVNEALTLSCNDFNGASGLDVFTLQTIVGA